MSGQAAGRHAPPVPDGRARFVLVHGAWHRGSCWSPLVAELGRRGFRADAPDLPSDRSGRGAQDYAGAVLDALGPSRDPVVLVGHSLGGLTVPVVAERLGPGRVVAMVLLAAMTPVPGTSFIGRLVDDPGLMVAGYDRGVRRGEDGTTFWPPEAVAGGLYRGVAEELEEASVAPGARGPDGVASRPGGADAVGSEAGDADGSGGSPENVVVTAADGLRPQAWTVGKEATPLRAWPAVRTVAIVCRRDRVADPDACRRAAADIGAEVVEIDGGHFPMLVRPAELADVLDGIAAGSRAPEAAASGPVPAPPDAGR